MGRKKKAIAQALTNLVGIGDWKTISSLRRDGLNVTDHRWCLDSPTHRSLWFEVHVSARQDGVLNVYACARHGQRGLCSNQFETQNPGDSADPNKLITPDIVQALVRNWMGDYSTELAEARELASKLTEEAMEAFQAAIHLLELVKHATPDGAKRHFEIFRDAAWRLRGRSLDHQASRVLDIIKAIKECA